MKKFNKKFLNDSPDEYGSIGWTVRSRFIYQEDGIYNEECLNLDLISGGKRTKKSGEVSAKLRITDCSDTIHLSFGTYDEVTIDVRLKKLDVLIDSLVDMRAAMEEVYEDSKIPEPNE